MEQDIFQKQDFTNGQEIRLYEEKLNTVLDYYQSTKFNPVLPSDTAQRHFRLRTIYGEWVKINKRIKTKEDLVEEIIKFHGECIYISTTTWANPSRLGPKSIGSIAYRLMLNQRVVFDIDADVLSLDHLDNTRLTTIKVLEYMDSMERYELEHITFTGLKGFCPSYYDHGLELPAHPRHRIGYIEERRKRFIADLPEDIKIDPCVYDATRIVKLPGSLHTSGLVCTLITRKQLNQPIESLINSIHSINNIRPVRLYQKPMIVPVEPKTEASAESSGLISPSKYYLASYITNKVPGIKDRYVLILSYSKIQNYEGHIRFLQRKFEIGPVFLFDLDNKIYAISLRTFQAGRLKKIVSNSLAMNRWEFGKFHRMYMRIGKLNFGSVFAGSAPQYLKTLSSESSEYLSLPHAEFVQVLGAEVPKGKFHGVRRLYMSQCLKKLKIAGVQSDI